MKSLGEFLLSLLLAAGCAAQPAASPKSVRIALLADPHTTRGTTGDEPKYRGRFDRVIADVNAQRVDVVLIAGDLTQGGRPGEYDDFAREIRRFSAPVFVTPGNHDLGQKAGYKQSKGPSPARVARFEQTIGPAYFATNCAGIRIVGIATPLLGSGLPVEARMWDFLEQEFAHPCPVPRIVLTHYPPFITSPDEPGGDYFNLEPGPRARLLALLRKGGVTMVLTGHLHRPLVNHYEGMLILTSLPVSFGLPPGRQPEGWTLVTLPLDGGEARWEIRTVAP